MTLRRYGHARTGIPFIPYVCGGGHRHSFGVTSCWFSLPVRFSLCFSWRRILALHGMYHTCVLADIADGVVCVCFVVARFPLFSFVHVFPFFVVGARTLERENDSHMEKFLKKHLG